MSGTIRDMLDSAIYNLGCDEDAMVNRPAGLIAIGRAQLLIVRKWLDAGLSLDDDQPEDES